MRTPFATSRGGGGVRAAAIGNLPSEADPGDVLSRTERRAQTHALFERRDASTDDVERDWLREQITALNMCVARSAAHRYRGRGEAEEDLEQVAYLGLVRAVNGFDSAYDKDFLSYAMPTIAGALKKHFRDYCWTVRPPRRIQDLQHTIFAAKEELSQEYDQPPTTAEVAAAIDVEPEEVEEALAAYGCFTPMSLDVGARRGESVAMADSVVTEENGFDRVEARMLLAPVIRDLPARDRDIIELRFFREWTQERIAQALGLTQMQVSRLIARIVNGLRKRITGAAD